MNFFRKLGRALDPTRRGGIPQSIGRLAVKAAPVAVGFIPGIGIPAAMAIGAGSKLLTRDKSIGSIARGAGTALASKLSSSFLGGGSGATAPGGAATPTPGLQDAMNAAYGAPAGAATPAVASAASAAASAPVASTAGGMAKAVQPLSRIGRIARFARENPVVTTGALSTAANVYGASQEGQAMDREADLRERELALREEESYARRYPGLSIEDARRRARYGYGG